MKINEILPETALIKKERIDEGFRFGDRERKQVALRRDVLVGIEYEYHIDEGRYDASGGEGDYDWDSLSHDVSRELDDERDEFVANYRENDMDEFNIEAITTEISNLEKIANLDSYKFIFNNLELEDDSDEPQQQLDLGEPGVSEKAKIYIEYVVELNAGKWLNSIVSLTDSDWSEGLERINSHGTSRYGEGWSHLDLSELAELESFANEYDRMGSNDIREELGKMVAENDGSVDGTELEEFVNKLNEIVDNIVVDWPGDGAMDEKMRETFEESGAELWDDDYLETRREEIEQRLMDSGNYYEGGTEELADEVRNDLEYNGASNWGLDWNSIDEVTTDSSVPDGVEVISIAEPIEDAMETMEAMFKHIRDVGSTSDSTGMHVNMSIKGLEFNKQNFNKVKFIILMDLANLVTRDSAGFIKFPPRDYVSDIFSDIASSEHMFSMASQMSFQGVIDYLDDFVAENTKYQSINFQHAFGSSVSPQRRRVEMRFFGGKDYENRYDEIYWNIHRAAYMMLAGFDKDFGDREYKELIYRWLNRISEERWNVSFAELVKAVRKIVRPGTTKFTPMELKLINTSIGRKPGKKLDRISGSI